MCPCTVCACQGIKGISFFVALRGSSLSVCVHQQPIVRVLFMSFYINLCFISPSPCRFSSLRLASCLNGCSQSSETAAFSRSRLINDSTSQLAQDLRRISSDKQLKQQTTTNKTKQKKTSPVFFERMHITDCIQCQKVGLRFVLR